MAKRSAVVVAMALAACGHAAPAPRGRPVVASAPLSLMTPPPGAQAGISAKAARADQLWQRRLEPAALQEATGIWQDMLARNPADHASRAALMRAYLFAVEGPLTMGEHPLTLVSTLQAAFGLAEAALIAACPPLQQQVRERLPQLGELPAMCGAIAGPWLFWYAAALTDLAMVSDVTVLLAWQKPLVTLWEDLIARGDASGDAHAYLGAFHARTPAFAGGNLKLAKAYLEQAVALQKDVYKTEVWYAEYVLLPLRMRDAALQTLHRIADAEAPKPADRAPEQQLAQLRARQLLEHIDDLL